MSESENESGGNFSTLDMDEFVDCMICTGLIDIVLKT